MSFWKKCRQCKYNALTGGDFPCSECSVPGNGGDDMFLPRDESKESRPPDKTMKADAGKPQLRLVPPDIIRAIAYVREYGVKKYGSTDGWSRVEPERYIDAAYRHMLAFAENPFGRDEESGLPHLWMLACNVAFLCTLYKQAFQRCEVSGATENDHAAD